MVMMMRISRIFAVGLALCALGAGHVYGMNGLTRFAVRTRLFASPQRGLGGLPIFVGNGSNSTPQVQTFATGTKEANDDENDLSPEELRVLCRAEADEEKRKNTRCYHPESAAAGNLQGILELVDAMRAAPRPSVRDAKQHRILGELRDNLASAMAEENKEEVTACIAGINAFLNRHFNLKNSGKR